MIPVVLMHGARVSRTMWRPQVEALRATGRTAVAIDLPGHGERLAERFTVAGGMAAITDAVDAVGGRAVLVGMSAGGYLALHHAARHPERVCGVVASGCSSVPDQPATAVWLLAVRRFFMRLPDKGAWLNQRLVDAALPPDGARAAGDGGFALEVMDDLLSELRRVDPRDDLARITCPVWLVNGQLDHFRLQERALARCAPDARVLTIRGATHLANLVRPVAYSRVLLEVLDELDRRAADDAAEATRPAEISGRAEASGRPEGQGSGLPVRQRPGPDAADDPR